MEKTVYLQVFWGFYDSGIYLHQRQVASEVISEQKNRARLMVYPREGLWFSDVNWLSLHIQMESWCNNYYGKQSLNNVFLKTSQRILERCSKIVLFKFSCMLCGTLIKMYTSTSPQVFFFCLGSPFSQFLVQSIEIKS